MKVRIVSLLLCLLCAGSLVVGCAAPQNTSNQKPSSEKPSSNKSDKSDAPESDEYEDEGLYFGHIETQYGEALWEDDQLIVVLEMDASGPYDWDYSAVDSDIIDFDDSEYFYGDELEDTELFKNYEGICAMYFEGMGEGVYTLNLFEYNTDTQEMYGEVFLDVYVDEDGYIYDVLETYN